MTTSKRLWTPDRAPYVASWSSELPVLERSLTLRPDGGGIAWADGTERDTDPFGGCWARLEGTQGEGEPLLDHMNPHRQRDCFLNWWCQVCATACSTTDQGRLFLRILDDPDPEGALVTQPPVCLPCAYQAVRRCPHLRGRAVAVRSRQPRLCRAKGFAYVPNGDGGLWPAMRVDVPLDDKKRLPWVLLSQYVVELRDCTVVVLDQELERHGATT
ncbi:hypothetical protein [Streptomyces lydicus]|uniref:hypothetical protein n=1 Tax=Streptomyces lydicus TaxID=47763 RepID=UPI003446F981